MLLAAVVATSLALQVPAGGQKKDSTKRDSTKGHTVSITIGGPIRRGDTITVVKDSTDSAVVGEQRRRRHSYSRRLPVTAQVLATSFRDQTARELLERARVSRMTQDSALLAYDATAYQRISAGMGFSRIGRDRLIFRTENVSRIRWQRGIGAWVELRGSPHGDAGNGKRSGKGSARRDGRRVRHAAH